MQVYGEMKTDYVDLSQQYNPSVEQTDEGNFIKVLKEIQSSGKVHWISISSTLPHVTTYIDSGEFDSFQIPYSALERAHESIITKAAESGAGTIILGGVVRGEPGVGLGNADRWATWEAKLDELLEEGESRIAFLLRFTLTHLGMNTTIVGTKIPDHLAENLQVAHGTPCDHLK